MFELPQDVVRLGRAEGACGGPDVSYMPEWSNGPEVAEVGANDVGE